MKSEKNEDKNDTPGKSKLSATSPTGEKRKNQPPVPNNRRNQRIKNLSQIYGLNDYETLYVHVIR